MAESMPRNKSEKKPLAPDHWPELAVEVAQRLATEAFENGMCADRMRHGELWGPYTAETNRWFGRLNHHQRALWHGPGVSTRQKRNYMADLMEFYEK